MSGEEPNSIDATSGSPDFYAELSGAGRSSTRSPMAIERRALASVLKRLDGPPIGLILWDGSEVALSGAVPECRLSILDPGALWRLAVYPEYWFPEMYARGRILVEGDLVRLMEIVQRVRRGVDFNSPARRLVAALLHSSGSRSQAQRNIYSHYDLGNDFYRLWLDRQMVYTCAYFPAPDTTLEQAQVAKLDHVCRKLRLRPGERVVEAGCGWGALALHMAREYGARVRAFNISKAQLAWARERVAREGLEGRVEFVEGDYREIHGRYDAFVSVGMLEHVGLKQYPELAGIMAGCLADGGRGLLHTIGTDRPGPLNPWIERRIFPGAQPPCLGEMMPLFGPSGFSILDVENLRLHYALTLKHWLRRFEAAGERVLAMYDPQFLRTWRFYLAASEASFSSGQLQLFQVLFARKGCNQVPWTRDYQYRDGNL